MVAVVEINMELFFSVEDVVTGALEAICPLPVSADANGVHLDGLEGGVKLDMQF